MFKADSVSGGSKTLTCTNDGGPKYGIFNIRCWAGQATNLVIKDSGGSTLHTIALGTGIVHYMQKVRLDDFGSAEVTITANSGYLVVWT